jgi:predicted DNA-binding transcriptional regulator AlpA
MTKRKHFLMVALEVPNPFCLRITFGDGAIMAVDLTETISRIPALAPLKDATLFAQAHIDEWGLSVVWLQGELDLAGDNLRAEAVEQHGGYSHERIWNWMHRNGLSLDSAAESLGISRRMLAYYRSGQKPVPRHIWLACVGWEAERQKAAA